MNTVKYIEDSLSNVKSTLSAISNRYLELIAIDSRIHGHRNSISILLLIWVISVSINVNASAKYEADIGGNCDRALERIVKGEDRVDLMSSVGETLTGSGDLKDTVMYVIDVASDALSKTGEAMGVSDIGSVIDRDKLEGLIDEALSIDINEGVSTRLLHSMMEYAIDKSSEFGEKSSELLDKMLEKLAENHNVYIEESDNSLDIISKTIEKLYDEHSDVENYSLDDLTELALDEAKGILDTYGISNNKMEGNSELGISNNKMEGNSELGISNNEAKGIVKSVFSAVRSGVNYIYDVINTSILSLFH